MAASQNSIQGSLFGETKDNDIDQSKPQNITKNSNDHLSSKQLIEDSSLRPRKKKIINHSNQITDLNELLIS